MLNTAAATAAKLLQSCLTLCDPIDSSPPGSPVPGILQARTLEWVAISFSNAQSEKWKWKWSRARLSATPWTAAHQAPPSMGFSRQEYWSGLPLPSPCDLKIIIIFNHEMMKLLLMFVSVITHFYLGAFTLLLELRQRSLHTICMTLFSTRSSHLQSDRKIK